MSKISTEAALSESSVSDFRNTPVGSSIGGPAGIVDDGGQTFSEDYSPRFDGEEILLERSDFQFRFANDRGRRNRSSALIQRMYSWRGYKCDGPDDPARDANQVTLQACRDDHVFGTLTVCFDSDAGLASDALYRAEIDAYRNAGAQVCELTRLAVDPEYGSKEVLGALFHLAYIQLGRLRKRTDIFIEVNPRHVSFYQRMLNFRQVGECRICERVDAPAVLLHVDVAYVAEQIALYGGHRARGVRSLYPYFFSAEEEEGLTRRLLGTARSNIHGRSRAVRGDVRASLSRGQARAA